MALARLRLALWRAGIRNVADALDLLAWPVGIAAFAWAGLNGLWLVCLPLCLGAAVRMVLLLWLIRRGLNDPL
jgi:hypothetical protein